MQCNITRSRSLLWDFRADCMFREQSRTALINSALYHLIMLNRTAVADLYLDCSSGVNALSSSSIPSFLNTDPGSASVDGIRFDLMSMSCSSTNLCILTGCVSWIQPFYRFIFTLQLIYSCMSPTSLHSKRDISSFFSPRINSSRPNIEKSSTHNSVTTSCPSIH